MILAALFIHSAKMAFRAEERLHAMQDVYYVVAWYLDDNEGRWPESAAELKSFDPPPELDVYLNYDWPEDADRALQHANVTYGIDLCDIDTRPFHAVVPTPGPTYLDPVGEVFLVETIERWQSQRCLAEDSDDDNGESRD